MTLTVPRANFRKLLADFRGVQQDETDRIDALRERYRELSHDVNLAVRACLQADLDTDRRLWTEDERAALTAAEQQYDDAYAAIRSFEAKYHHILKAHR